jgi:hypothetical protein
LVGGEAIQGVVGLGASSVESVAQVADFGLELGDVLLELCFALAGALVHGLVVMSLLTQAGAFELVRTRALSIGAGKQGKVAGGWLLRRVREFIGGRTTQR